MSPLARAARPIAFVLAAGLLVGVSAPEGRLEPGPSPAAAASIPTLGIDAIRPGQRAVGRTVFTGNTIEEFELEIVGTLPGGRAEGAMILARALGPRMEHDGIAAGMSGSPIYVDGKLIGALAFGWPFSRDALCGIQPIADMLAVMQTPDRAPGGSFDDGPILTTQAGPESAIPVRAGLERLRTPLTAGGFPPAAFAALAPWADAHGFTLVRGGGGGTSGATGAPARVAPEAARAALAPGAAIAVDLMRGDMNLAAIGTLTHRDGDRIVAFGHPFFQIGDVAYPLALADVTTIVANDQSSFKLGTPGAQVGAITQDRRAAVAGSIGPIPRMLPMTVLVRDGRRPAADAPAAYRFDLLRHRLLVAQLASIGVVGALADASGGLPEATWRYRATVRFPGRAPLVLEDTAGGPINAASTALAAPLRLLLDNPFAPLTADSVGLDLTVWPGMAQGHVEALRLASTIVRPGQGVTVVATVRDRRGGEREIAFTLPVPNDQPDGRLVVAVGGGGELDRQEAARMPARHRAATLDALIARLADRRRDDHLYATLYGPGLEPVVDGVPYPDLPDFAQRMLATERANRPTDPWGRLSPLAEKNRDVAVPVVGLLTLTVEVRRHPDAPVRAGERGAIPVLRAPERDEEDN